MDREAQDRVGREYYRMFELIEALATGYCDPDEATTTEQGILCVIRDVLHGYREDARALLRDMGDYTV